MTEYERVLEERDYGPVHTYPRDIFENGDSFLSFRIPSTTFWAPKTD